MTIVTMYALKQFVGSWAAPLPAALIILFVAAFWRWRRGGRTPARLAIVAVAIAYIGSMSMVGTALLTSLENRYPPFSNWQQTPEFAAVVVLGSGYAPRDGLPVTAALSDEGLQRIVEGVRLARHLGDIRLVASGGAAAGWAPSATGYALLARELGVDEKSLVMLHGSLDTGDEARAVVALLGDKPFVLVTSAYHMPRAMRLMQRAGARPVAAPTGHQLKKAGSSWRDLMPGSSGLKATERALHEYLGLAALAMGID